MTLDTQTIISAVLFIGVVIFFVGNFRKGRSESSNNTIDLLKDEVDALKLRLESTGQQITQMNATITNQTLQISELQKDNHFYRKLINEALESYIKTHGVDVTKRKTRK